MAIRAKEPGFIVFAEAPVQLEEMVTDFTFKLRAFFTVIVVDIGVRRIAERADNLRRHICRMGTLFNRTKRLAVNCLIFR